MHDLYFSEMQQNVENLASEYNQTSLLPIGTTGSYESAGMTAQIGPVIGWPRRPQSRLDIANTISPRSVSVGLLPQGGGRCMYLW